MSVLQTPEERFTSLPGYPFDPHYVLVEDPDLGPLRMHYVDEGPAESAPVILLHGQPTWSYLYRHVVASLIERGHRVIAPDLIGFGRSDKLEDRTEYSYARHCGWVLALVEALGLEGATLVVQDWGGPIGLGVLSRAPARFARVVATNTILYPASPETVEMSNWPVRSHQGLVTLPAALLDYVLMVQRTAGLDASVFVRFATTSDLDPAVLAAYDAPFPTEALKSGLRMFPALIPFTANDPGTAIGKATWAFLEQWTDPFLTAFSDGDEATRGWDRIFQTRIPGCTGLEHPTIERAGHFVQEDRPAELARIIDGFVRATR